MSTCCWVKRYTIHVFIQDNRHIDAIQVFYASYLHVLMESAC